MPGTGRETLCRGNKIIMLWEQDLKAWEQDKKHMSLLCLPYICNIKSPSPHVLVHTMVNMLLPYHALYHWCK